MAKIIKIKLECGNLNILLPFRFYVKSILLFLECWKIVKLTFLLAKNFSFAEYWNCRNGSGCRQNWFHGKICIAVNFLNFHIVQTQFYVKVFLVHLDLENCHFDALIFNFVIFVQIFWVVIYQKLWFKASDSVKTTIVKVLTSSKLISRKIEQHKILTFSLCILEICPFVFLFEILNSLKRLQFDVPTLMI